MDRTCDLTEIPLTALGFKSRDFLSRQLDKLKVIPSDHGLPRDYRGLAQIANVGCDDVRNPTSGVLALWLRVHPTPTFQDLVDGLGHLDRWDVVDDLGPLLKVDALNYSLKLRQVVLSNNGFGQSSSNDSDIVTYDDADLVRIGLPAHQKYDAYLLYADQDEEIALDIINKLENQYRLKLCVKDRDIIPGASFEHEAITYLITERCNKLIVVLTPDFLNCPAQKFIYNYTVADSIRERVSKIIPCIFRVSPSDEQITRRIFKLTYSRMPINFLRSNPWGHWNKLVQAISPETWDKDNNCIKALEYLPPMKGIESSKSTTDNPQKQRETDDPKSMFKLQSHSFESDKENHNASMNISSHAQIDSSKCPLTDVPSSTKSTAFLLPDTSQNNKSQSKKHLENGHLSLGDGGEPSGSSTQNADKSKNSSIVKLMKSAYKGVKKKYKKKKTPVAAL